MGHPATRAQDRHRNHPLEQPLRDMRLSEMDDHAQGVFGGISISTCLLISRCTAGLMSMTSKRSDSEPSRNDVIERFYAEDIMRTTLEAIYHAVVSAGRGS